MVRKSIDEEVIRKIIELHKKGCKISYISNILKLSRSTILKYLHIKEEAAFKIGRPCTIDKSKLEEALKLYKEGHTLHTSAKHASINPNTFYRYIKKAGIQRIKKILNEEKVEKILQLYKEDYDLQDIIKITSMRLSIILKHVKAAGIPMRTKNKVVKVKSSS